LEATGFGPDADGPLAQERLGGRGTLGALRTEHFELLVRRYRRGGLLGSARGERFADARRALAEAAVGLALLERGLRTPAPLGVRARPHARGGLRLELILERRTAAVDFGRAWLDGDASLRQELERELGTFIAALHAAGLVHRDLHWRNLLVEPRAPADERLWIIDLDRASLAPAALDRDARLTQWARFWRAFDKRRRAGAPAPAATSAKRVLDTYLDAGDSPDGDPNAWIRDVHARLAWRRRLQRLRPRPKIEDLRV
jgi:tRNA A-37 threonylcarbamoyl transferase component Bud32